MRSSTSSLALAIVRINTITLLAEKLYYERSAHATAIEPIPEEEPRALILVFSAFPARVSDIEELALTVASIEALVTVWTFVSDQEVDLGRAVVVVASERGALRRGKKSEIVLALLSEDRSERVGTGLKVTASIIAVHSGQSVVYPSEECDEEGKRGRTHGGCVGERLEALFSMDEVVLRPKADRDILVTYICRYIDISQSVKIEIENHVALGAEHRAAEPPKT